MVLTATRGALGFLSRLPTGHDSDAWQAFTHTPVAFPLVGYLLGAVLAAPLLLPMPGMSAAFVFVGWVFLVTGINHADGLIDLGDAVVAHGDVGDRREILKDTSIGAGGAVAAAGVVFGLGTAALGITRLPPQAVTLVLVAEVGAKAAMAAVVCFGSAAHDGLGSEFTGHASPVSVTAVVLVILPVALVGWPRVASGVATLVAAGVIAAVILRWATRHLDGVNGDVLGATNELARVGGLHTGVIVWTLS